MTSSSPDGSSPDGSRDRRIEDPSNLWLIHPLGRALLPYAVQMRIPANAVSIAGLGLGIGAAWAYAHWQDWRMALIGLSLSIGWLVADGLDGMVARATGTSSALGRALDGLVDHGVFTLIYVAIALSIDTREGWVLALCAGAAHAVQSSLYEGERARFHRRAKGIAAIGLPALSGGPFVRLYDFVATSVDRLALRFERRLHAAADAAAFGRAYRDRATSPMRLMALLTANVRVWMIVIACLAGNPRIFWWFEIVPLTIVALIGIVWHRRVERAFVHTIASVATEDRGARAFTRKGIGL